MLKITVPTFGCLLIFLCCLDHKPGLAQQKAHSTKVKIKENIQYQLYLPPNYQADKSEHFPIMLFLHGGGESGNDIELVKKHGPPMLAEQGKDFPFIILSPQNPHKKRLWDETVVMHLLEKVVDKYRVDKSRIYLAGLSRGGYGVWRLAVQYPERFAAMVAICGEAPSEYASWIGDMPIWVFHGEDDPTISVETSDRMVAALKANGNAVKYTRYPNTQHDSWKKAFATPELYDWLLQQKKSE